jgi:hypothetical protein
VTLVSCPTAIGTAQRPRAPEDGQIWVPLRVIRAVTPSPPSASFSTRSRTATVPLDAYIIGENLRFGSADVKAALSRQGRYTEITENMRVKEVRRHRTVRDLPQPRGRDARQAHA